MEIPKSVPIKEDFPIRTYNKSVMEQQNLMIEQILKDLYISDRRMEYCIVTLLLIPIGAHASGLLGESPK